MQKTNTATTAKRIATCALASALALGSFATPALAATNCGATGPAVVAQGYEHMGAAEAAYIARTFLRIAPETICDVECEPLYGKDYIRWEVEIETINSDAEYHVVVDAFDGTVLSSWVEYDD